jgi:acid phosphatase (class A)
MKSTLDRRLLLSVLAAPVLALLMNAYAIAQQGSATQGAAPSPMGSPSAAPPATSANPDRAGSGERPAARERPPISSYYFDPRTLDLARILPPAPTNDSAITRGEIELMLRIQAERTPEQAERAKGDAAATIYRFADALGNPEAFTPAKVPKLEALVRKVTYEEGAIIQAGKRSFDRPRPFLLEPRIVPLVDKPPNAAYPSGHTMWARTMGLLLADMLPEYREKIMARADEYAFNRVVAGVHYPSDIESGKLAGTALTAFLMAAPSFQKDFAEARKELREVLKLPTIQ